MAYDAAVAGPGREGRHDQVAYLDQRTVIVHSPAREIIPGLLAVGFELQPRGFQLYQHGVKFRAVDANRIGREEIRDASSESPVTLKDSNVRRS